MTDRRIKPGDTSYAPFGAKEASVSNTPQQGKTPYEIRLDVLKLAQEMAGLKYKAAEVEFLSAQTYGTVEPPKAASAADIISDATMLYEFVSNNSRTISKK